MLHKIIILAGTVLLCCFRQEALAAEAVSLSVYEQDWGQTTSMKGLFDSSTMYFQVGNWEVTEAVLELRMNASQLLNEEAAYLTVKLNGQPLQTIPVTWAGGGTVSQRIVLPPDILIREGGNSITVEAYLRGRNPDACVDDSTVSMWMNIFKDSGVVLTYRPLQQCYDIAQFYDKFTSIEALKEGKSLVATGSGAGEGTLTAIARILSGFARNAPGDYETVKVGILQEEKDLQKAAYVLYVDTYERLPGYLLAAMTGQQKEYASRQALVCLLERNGCKVLLVTGQNAEALKSAGDLLSNREMVQELTRSQELIDSEKNYKEDPYEVEEYLSLTEYGVEIRGNFEQRASFVIEAFTNRKIADSAQLSLDYRYSQNIDFDKSLLTIYVDGVPIGSRTLSEAGADDSTDLFSIPGNLQISGSFTIDTVFQLYPKGDWCEVTPEELPWAYIADTSMIKYTTVENTDVFFEEYPFPFIRDGSFSDVAVLLPENWSEPDLWSMADILLTMGKWQKSNSGELNVMCGLREAELTRANLISIGDVSKNPLKTSRSSKSGSAGWAQVMLSPFGSDKLYGALVVTGGSANGMLKTTKWLGDADRLWELQGDWFVTDGTEVSCRYIRQREQPEVTPEKEKVIISDDNISIIIVGSVVILVLLSGAMLLFKYGKEKK